MSAISPGSMSNGQQTSADEHAPPEPVERYRADIDKAERAHDQPDTDRAPIEARLAELYAAQEAATSWGAAVGVRHEEIKSLQSRLRAISTPKTAPAATVVIPREPTREMWAAMANAVVGKTAIHHDHVVAAVYGAILSSAPAPHLNSDVQNGDDARFDQVALDIVHKIGELPVDWPWARTSAHAQVLIIEALRNAASTLSSAESNCEGGK